MIRNKRMEIVVIFTMLVLCFFCLYSIDEKLSQKHILKNTYKYIDSLTNNAHIAIEEKITYNNRFYIFYSYSKSPMDNSNTETIGVLEFEKNFLGWLCLKESSATDKNIFVQSIDSVKGTSACLLYGKNVESNFQNLKIGTKEKNITKDISHKKHYIYLEEIDKNSVKEIKLN